ncbi:hypothetical protein IFM89_020757 [Coptis chinensis]|uniref:NAC-A/B domain-containing protein n=1 Tax=Coptis chinensis TaxID=261450 RepID=A0A835ICW4_9MAGN|nr:hypothetical protein IFM89_020757 [Coptis chinensis]
MVCDEVIKLSLKLYNALYARHGDGSGRSKQSRSEKKSRKAMLKLGMKAIPSASRITVKKSKNVAEQASRPRSHHVISKPESSAMAQDDEDVDETGVEPKDKISNDAGWCVKIKGAESAQGHDGDIVSAIMELTN